MEYTSVCVERCVTFFELYNTRVSFYHGYNNTAKTLISFHTLHFTIASIVLPVMTYCFMFQWCVNTDHHGCFPSTFCSDGHVWHKPDAATGKTYHH